MQNNNNNDNISELFLLRAYNLMNRCASIQGIMIGLIVHYKD